MKENKKNLIDATEEVLGLVEQVDGEQDAGKDEIPAVHDPEAIRPLIYKLAIELRKQGSMRDKQKFVLGLAEVVDQLIMSQSSIAKSKPSILKLLGLNIKRQLQNPATFGIE